MAAIPRTHAMMANLTLKLLHRIRITARPFLVMQMQISQIKASAVQRRIKFTCYLGGCFACVFPTRFGVLNMFENAAMVSPAFLIVLMVFAVECDEVCCLAFHGYLDFFGQDGAIGFFLVDDFRGVLHQNICREGAEFFEFDGRVIACLVDRAAEPSCSDLRVDGYGAVGCTVVIAEHALFDLTEFIIRVEIYVGFDVLERYVNRHCFACDGDAVRKALFAVERFGFVQIV